MNGDCPECGGEIDPMDYMNTSVGQSTPARRVPVCHEGVERLREAETIDKKHVPGVEP